MLAPVFIMIILITIVWYLIGSIGGLCLSRKIYSKTTNRDLVFLFTIGGIGGLFTFFIGLTYLSKGKWWNMVFF